MITRRQFVTLAGAAGIAPFLPGCSRSNPGPSDIYVGAQITEGFDLGVDSSGHLRSWVTIDPGGFAVCSYPGEQTWGAIYLFARGESPSVKKTYDYSSYGYLSIDLKKISGGDVVEIGVKTENDRDDGMEPRHKMSNLTAEWQTCRVPLVDFVKEPEYPGSRLNHLHVVCLLSFPGREAETINFRNVRYTP